MATSNHHIGLRTVNLDPFEVSGEMAEMVAGGPPGTKMRIQPLEFPGGGAIELFEFLVPTAPMEPIPPWQSTITHFAIQVDDTDKALARVEAAGGRRLWPEVRQLGDLRFVYVSDLDASTIELTDGTKQHGIELTKRFFDRAPERDSG
jgi:hypothetical protein